MPQPLVRASLHAAVRAVEPGVPFEVGVRLQMPPGWHTYWKNPGDSGLETHVRWQLPPGFTAGPLKWPTPQLIHAGPLTSYGYEGVVVLFTTLTPPSDLPAGKPVTIRAQVDWLVCKETCIPEKADISISLSIKHNVSFDSNSNSWLGEFKAHELPLPPGAWEANGRVADDPGILEASLRLKEGQLEPGTLQGVEFFPEAPGLLQSDALESYALEGPLLTLRLRRAAGNPALPAQLRGVLVLQLEGGARRADEVVLPLEKDGARAFANSKPAAGGFARGPGLGLALLLPALLAFGGGLLLNLMPCVLPVLSLKVFSLVKQSDHSRALRLEQAAAYALGVVAACLALGGLLLWLRAAGESVGWGFQMQSPAFVACLACLFWVLALNFLGVFEIGASLVGADTKLAGASAGSRKKHPLLGSLATGVLAVVAATPCTAPFMGSALGFAATQPAAMALLIFGMLGAGLAFPYVLLAAAPRLAAWLPRPGAWMESLKQFFGFALAATVVYLLWVLSLQSSPGALLQLLFSLWLLGLACWIYGRWATPVRAARTRWLARLMAGLLALLALRHALAGAAAVSASPENQRQAPAASASGLAWEPYSAVRLAELRAQGRPVFVDFTAAWCLTCQVNERTALAATRVRDAFSSKTVALLRADWTRRDPAITEALTALGRSGVPVYALYPADAHAPPALLPEVLTAQAVVDAVERLGK